MLYVLCEYDYYSVLFSYNAPAVLAMKSGKNVVYGRPTKQKPFGFFFLSKPYYYTCYYYTRFGIVGNGYDVPKQ